MRFAWDDTKAARNWVDHGVTFEEASTVLNDPYLLVRPDVQHSIVEDRVQAIGMSDRFRVLFVVYVELHEDFIRIISARKADRQERQQYESDRGLAQKR